jgi:hypothetical protein
MASFLFRKKGFFFLSNFLKSKEKNGVEGWNPQNHDRQGIKGK